MVNTAFQLKQLPLDFNLNDPPYENYFYADHIVSCHVVLASPLPRIKSNATAVHRLLFAWPGGNSGAAVFFEGSSAKDTLHIKLLSGDHGRILNSIAIPPAPDSLSKHPSVGVSGLLEFLDGAVLNLAILGSVRTIRDYAEGRGILNPKVQEGIQIVDSSGQPDGIDIKRVWFDGKTTTNLSFAPNGNGRNEAKIVVMREESGDKVMFAPGVYSFKAHLDYPQPSCMHPAQLLKPSFHHFISQKSDAVHALSFLSSPEKLLAGAWRFLTYFGRDTLISLLLLGQILSEGEHGALEAGLSAVLERVNWEDGSVCHEENIGDYPAAQAARTGHSNSGAQYDYKMIDTDFFLPVVMEQYFVKSEVGRERLAPFLRTPATIIASNVGKTYGELFERACKKIMMLAKPFSDAGGQTYKNLIGLKAGRPVGQWRDSNHGLGGGQYPYDVNTALMPAALRAIAKLVHVGAFDHRDEWDHQARQRAEIWEISTLELFTSVIPVQEAKRRLKEYKGNGAFPGPCGADLIDEDIYLQAVALKADGSPIEIMHSDAGFRLLLLPHLVNSSNPTSVSQHLLAINALADSILRTFPAGLFSPVGVLIANPAYSVDPFHTKMITTGAYHGTVVWSWNSLAMLAKGLEVQLTEMASNKPAGTDGESLNSETSKLRTEVQAKLKRSYSKVWETIEASKEHSMAEVWSWYWKEPSSGEGEDGKGGFQYLPLSHVATPDGEGQTESNALQLWSLAILALERKRELEV